MLLNHSLPPESEASLVLSSLRSAVYILNKYIYFKTRTFITSVNDYPPDTTEKKRNAEALADGCEGEDVDADDVAAVHEAVLVAAVTALPPQLARVVKQLAHGHGAWDGAEQSDQQPLDAQRQTPHPGVHTPQGRRQSGYVGQERDAHRQEERNEKYWKEYTI